MEPCIASFPRGDPFTIFGFWASFFRYTDTVVVLE